MHMTYDQWMQRTNLGMLSVRSQSLKGVDAAMKNYDAFPTAAHLRKLSGAFSQWKSQKADWAKSDRNHKGGVTDLDTMLRGPSADLTPMDYMIEQRQRLIDTMFRGRTLVTRRSKMIIPGVSAAGSLENIRRGAAALGAPSPAFQDTITSLFRGFFGAGSAHVSLEVEVANYLGTEVLGDLVKNMAPYAGILTSGVNAVFQFGKLAQAYYGRSVVKACRTAVRMGDPYNAVLAIEQVLSRDVARRATQGTMSAFEAIARGAATAAAGPAAETIAAGLMGIAKLTYQVYVIGRDFQEKAHANDVMAGTEPITYTVFDEYALLGCYYLVCVDTSDVVNRMVYDIGTDSWMDSVEKLTKRIQPVIGISRRLIAESRFEIPHMPKLAKATAWVPPWKRRGDYQGYGSNGMQME